MKKTVLTEKVNACKSETRVALQMLYDNVNKGQQKQIIKNQEVKEMFDRYGVDYSDI